MTNQTETTQTTQTSLLDTPLDLITIRMMIRTTQRKIDRLHREIYSSKIAEREFLRALRQMESLQAQHIQITGGLYYA